MNTVLSAATYLNSLRKLLFEQLKISQIQSWIFSLQYADPRSVAYHYIVYVYTLYVIITAMMTISSGITCVYTLLYYLTYGDIEMLMKAH